MFALLSEPEYEVRDAQKGWEILKFETFHWKSIDRYWVRINEENKFYCTCQAGLKCKHIWMVAEHIGKQTSPKKDLF